MYRVITSKSLKFLDIAGGDPLQEARIPVQCFTVPAPCSNVEQLLLLLSCEVAVKCDLEAIVVITYYCKSGGWTWGTALYNVRGVGSGSRDVDT